jgi:hypothetical protein
MPHYPLKNVKDIIQRDTGWSVEATPEASEDALYDFGWGIEEMKQCILKLNDRPYYEDRNKNHFVKTGPHKFIPNTKVDSYRAKKILQENDIFTHFYIHPNTGNLVINSFKEK